MTEKEKYYMFVDECGDQNLTSLDENFPIFTLCGVLMSHSQLRGMEERISGTIGKTMCLGIDILKSEEEVFDIGYASQLSTEVLYLAVE